MELRTKSRYEAKRKYWQQQINNWKTSELSQKHYCRSHSLALSTFCYWKSKINKSEPTTPRFYPLTIPTSPTNSSDADLLLLVGSKRFQIQIKENFSPSALKRLIATLEQL